MLQDLNNSTICAPATAVGHGAIAVIRVSGPSALEIVSKIFVSLKGRKLDQMKGYTMCYGSISAGVGNLLDDAIVAVFRAPESYTGQDMVEIYSHCSPYIVSKILELLVSYGCRYAEPGEFTKRAFLNGKMDLAQAEAVADVIASETEAAHKIAIRQLKGGFSKELAQMRTQLLKIVSLMELELDFSEEDVEFADREQLKALLEKTSSHVSELISSFKLGNAIKNGVPVAIVGNTNSGKSTLLNALLGENRAIVSDIAGTTRDTIEETCNLDGVLFRFIDTAGLRQSDDTIERIGIERAYEKLSAAQLVLAMLDLTQPLGDLLASASHIADRATDGQQLVFLLNKADAVSVSVSTAARRAFSPLLAAPGRQLYTISAKAGLGLEDLRHALAATWRDLDTAAETSLVTNARHLAALQNAATALRRVRDGLGTCPTDLLAQDLRESLYHLGSITGEITPDEVLGNIFRNFCIGK